MSIGFSKTFGFDRKSLSKLLMKYAKDSTIPREQVMKILGVGSQKAEAIVAWTGMTGLRDNKKRMLTPLGFLIAKHDPFLEDIGTQFALHYQLASNPNAVVWYTITNKFLSFKTSFSFEDALNFLIYANVGSREDKHLNADLSIYIRSLLYETALGDLKLIQTKEKIERNLTKAQFQVSPPLNIPPYLVAYGLYHYRDIHNPNLRTISIKDALTLDGNVGKVFLLSRERLEETIKLLSNIEYGQYVNLVKVADIDQIEMRFTGNAIELLEKYYTRRR